MQYLAWPNRRWTIGVVVSLIVLCSSSAGLYLFGPERYSENQIRRLIQDAYNHQRPGGGRLFGAQYSAMEDVPPAMGDLGRAQLLLLRYPGSAARQGLQSKVYLASGEWRKFVEDVSLLSPERRQDPATLNNLGASYLALSGENPTYLLKALDEFERASELRPDAPEPRFNRVIAYRNLRLPKLADEVAHQYERYDRGSPWHRELTSTVELDESLVLDELRRAVESNNLPEAARLFEKNPELCRRHAMQYGLSKNEEPAALVRFIGSEIEGHFADKTISAMLAPLFTNRRDVTVAARDLVTIGARLYVEGNLQGSLETYSKADDVADKAGSLFDRLWIDINRVDTQIRGGEIGAARDSLQRVITAARQNEFKWLLARALTIYGSSVTLSSSYGEMMELLTEADRVFGDIGASYDRVRPLYYLAGHRYGAGDQDEALRLALESLRLTSDDDFLRIASLDWLIGSILYRQGMPSRAALFETESLEQTQKTKNATLETVAASTLAQLYASMSEPKLAEQYANVAADSMERVPTRYDRMKAEVPLNLVKARLHLDQRRHPDAEALLKKNLDLFSQGLLKATFLQSQSLMLLARSYSETERLGEAAQKFNEAIELVENDDQYLETEKRRIKFDDERRDLYDSAIEFEYRHGSADAAWTYLQKYRAKLFLEFLAQFNPDIEQVRG